MNDDRQQFLHLGDTRSGPSYGGRALVTRVLDSFDFERVHTAVAALGWTYTGEVTTPEIPRLRATAGQLLESAVIERNDGAEFHCGGFRASWHAGNTVVLRFEIASARATLAE